MIIKIVGEEQDWVKSEVQDMVVKLNKAYYWKHDTEHVVRIATDEGYQFFTKKSKKIVKDAFGQYRLKSETVVTLEGVRVPKNHNHLRYINDKGVYTFSGWIYDGKHISDNSIIVDPINRILHDKAALKLSSKLYGVFAHVRPGEHESVADVDGYGNVYVWDMVEYITPDGEMKKVTNQPHLRFYDSLDASSESYYVPVTVLSPSKRVTVACNGSSEDIDKFVYIEEYGVLSTNDCAAGVRRILAARDKGPDKALKLNMDAFYKEAGPDENNATHIDREYRRSPGGVKYSKSPSPAPIISKTYNRTGGKRYTFGIEYETAAGNLSEVDCIKGMFEKYGDRSIPAYEYVTGILSGTKGMQQVKKQCDLLSDKTMVNDECSIHIHIGGFGDGHIDSPSFNRIFSINAIKLGTLLEEELYMICPTTRNPFNKHTASILAYKDINPKNWDSYLSSYIFGGGEGPEEDEHFGRRNNVRRELGRWNPSRYRWLNLNHCNTSSRFKTIEFRMFAGTTNVKKVSAYILICLAFVWAVENRPAKIWQNKYTLTTLIKDAYERFPTLAGKLTTFIEERKNKFNRKNIYK